MSSDASPTYDDHGVALRLSSQRALLGNVPASLRCASVEYRGTEIACRFVFDGEPEEEERGLLSCAATEIIADYPEPYTISEEHLRHSEPSRCTASSSYCIHAA
jgi:hypothetical protein